ncbi:nicotinate-nucleotide adenylyltransferase [Entomobacter blattae]|uniref:nicotinate-nucleotide adenylyltransferase n=1 Tax=Entomobacter blattae TaxID=2762277 RepID=UPI001EF0BE23|nr:nicotinate-nucleotide adenylyltransferase [Entomobacter blattae]
MPLSSSFHRALATPSRWGDGRRIRVGLLGGSFNPAHKGHMDLALFSLRRFQLDQVWLMVSPGNPLKPIAGMAPFLRRLDSVKSKITSPRLIATDIEQAIQKKYTYETIKILKARFPHAQFIWLMGADSLIQFPRWKFWKRLAALVPIGIVPRPSYTYKALHGQAASYLRHGRLGSKAFSSGAFHQLPSWCLPLAKENQISATAIRKKDMEKRNRKRLTACKNTLNVL